MNIYLVLIKRLQNLAKPGRFGKKIELIRGMLYSLVLKPIQEKDIILLTMIIYLILFICPRMETTKDIYYLTMDNHSKKIAWIYMYLLIITKLQRILQKR